MHRHTIFDALRRLPVVIGCVVLAAAQPMSGNEQSAPGLSPDTVLYPQGRESGPRPSSNLGYGNPFYLMMALLVAGTGAWVLWRRRVGAPLLPGAAPKGLTHLSVEETKGLGNRQYLVVAAYKGRRFLLGVTTDKIELLTHLPGEDEAEEEKS